MALSASTIHTSDAFSVSVSVANGGAMDAAEVVQVYATDLAASAVTANTALVGFAKVTVPAGKSARVTVPVRNEQLKLWSSRQRWEVEPGNFTIRVGTSVDTYASATLSVVA
jgi:beta-glucosidase